MRYLPPLTTRIFGGSAVRAAYVQGDCMTNSSSHMLASRLPRARRRTCVHSMLLSWYGSASGPCMLHYCLLPLTRQVLNMQTRASESREIRNHVVHDENFPDLIVINDEEVELEAGEAAAVEAEAPPDGAGGLHHAEYYSAPFRIWRGTWQLLNKMGRYDLKTFEVVKYRLSGDSIKYATCLKEEKLDVKNAKHTCKIDFCIIHRSIDAH